MERTGTLIREKYRENLISTLAMSGRRKKLLSA